MNKFLNIIWAICIIFTSCEKDPEIIELTASSNVNNISAEGGTIFVYISGDTSNCSISTSDYSWGDDMFNYANLNTYNTLVISVKPNTSISPRYGYVVISPSYGDSLYIWIDQSGKAKEKLGTPSGIIVENIGTKNEPIVQISWDPVPNSTSYKVKKTFDYYGTKLSYEFDGISYEYFIDKGVDTNMTFSYQVCACADDYYSSNWSKMVSISL